MQSARSTGITRGGRIRSAVFEKFTEKAIKVVMLAQEEARRLGHNYVGTEMLLLGVVGEPGKVRALFEGAGLTLSAVRNEVERQIGRGAGFVAVEIPFTPRAKRALEDACVEAKEMNHTSISVSHLLLGLLDGDDSVAVRVLETFEVNLDSLRDDVLKVLEKQDVQREKPPFPPRPGAEERYRNSHESSDTRQPGIKVVHLAQEEARRLGHNFVGTEQILIALIIHGGRLGLVLLQFGIPLDWVRQKVEAIIGRGSGLVAPEIPFTPRAKRVLELSWDESRQLGHNFIGVEHLMLGLLREGGGVAYRVLNDEGINFEKLRSAIIALFDEKV